MRIGFDAKRLFNNFTGLGNYSRFVVDALAQQFPDEEYLLYTPKLRQHPETKHYLSDSHFSVRTPQGISKTFSSYWRSVSLAHVALSDGVNLFHGLSNELPLQKPAKLKTVVTVHDLIFKRFPQYYNPIDVQIYSWKLKKACASADIVVAVSQQTANDLREFVGVPDRKLRVVYQGCHPNFKAAFSAEQKEAVKKKYDLPREFVLYVGTLEQRKNAELIIRASAQLGKNVPIVMVGKKTSYQTKLDELVSAHRVASQIKFLHSVSFADLPAIYQSATVFVYPSLFEGFGIPIVEAITSNVPVITSHGSCFDEAGGPATKYINPTQPEGLAGVLNTLLSNESLRAEMVRKSSEYIQRFEPAVIAQHMMSVYREIV